jgi:hypothetical protein
MATILDFQLTKKQSFKGEIPTKEEQFHHVCGLGEFGKLFQSESIIGPNSHVEI